MRRLLVLAAAALLGAIAAAILAPGTPPRVSGPLRHEAYVWQRSWTEDVREAVATRGPEFALLSVLVAEVDLAADPPEVVRVSPDGGALVAAGVPVGASLRIAPWRGTFREDDGAARFLVGEARAALAALRERGVEPAELQIDFDAAESQLGGYASWVREIRRAVRPVPVSITALPSWLDRGEIVSLLAAADGWVLQVHSLEAPAGPDAPWRLCDPARARAAVEAAARLDRPFRVALPTYGYQAAFDADGKLMGIRAEGGLPEEWHSATLREVLADAAAMAGLVAGWERDRPEALAGVIWFRLPVAGDRRAWRWPTLAAVMEGLIPTPDVRAVATRPEPGLVDVAVVNEGDGDAPAAPEVAVRWEGGRLLAADSFQGWRWEPAGAGAGRFVPDGRGVLRAGETRAVGWLRFANETVELRVDAR